MEKTKTKKTEMCNYTTSLQEVDGVSFRVMKVLCKRSNTDTTILGQEHWECNTTGHEGRFQLKFPDQWDLTAPIYVAVASVSISGIPCWNQDHAYIGQANAMSCCPRSFAIRSNALGSAGNVLEAKRYRGQITGIDTRRIQTALVAGVPAAIPYSSTKFLGIQTGEMPPPVGLPADLEEIPVYQSNILQLVPNTFNMNWENDQWTDKSGVWMPFSYTTMYYGVFWKKAVKLGTSGLRVPMDNAQTIIDLYITANYDKENIPDSQTGVVVWGSVQVPPTPNLLWHNLTWQFQGNSINYLPFVFGAPTFNYPNAGVGIFYPELLLSNGTGIGTSTTHDRAGWNVELVFYQLEN